MQRLTFAEYALIISVILFSHTLNAKTLVLMSDDGPPHMIAKSKNGIDIDITTQVLASMGYHTKVMFAPLARGKMTVEQGDADAFLPTFYQSDNDNLFHSAPIIYYRPTVFTLSKLNYNFNQLADIAGKRIVSFQGATGYFGSHYNQAISQSFYKELHDMSKFPEMLLKGRFDVVVLDYYIFYYYLRLACEQNELVNSELCQQDITEHALFPLVSAHVGFNDEALRDRFNVNLEQFKASGQVDIIIERYLAPEFTQKPQLNKRQAN